MTFRGIETVRANGARRMMLLVATSVATGALLSACAVKPKPFTAEELASQATSDRSDMFKGGEPVAGPLTMADAIARALKYNLEKRSRMMEEALALGQTQLDRFDLLPKFVVSAGYNERTTPNATISRDMVTQTTADTNPTYSTDRWTRTLDLGLSWNILDFGLTYFTARQNADRALIATERRRKTVQNLVADTSFAFWRAAAYQELRDDVDRAVGEAGAALETARTVERENLKAPAEALRYQKSLLETLRQLTAIQQELSTARIELAALLNLPPGASFALAVPADLAVPQWDMALESMEDIAFLHNPDLHEQGYLTRIAVDDTRKAILRLLPGITFTADRKNDYNSFLIDNHWYEAGAKLTWNLVNVLSGPSAIAYAETNEDVAMARRLALRMAVLAQVHVSERQFRSAGSQFLQSDALWLVDRRLAEIADAKTSNDAQGMLERVAAHASSIASQLRRFQTYAQVKQAFAKMQASLGRDPLPENIEASDLKATASILTRRLDAWARGEVEASTPPAPAPATAEPAAPAEPAPDRADADADAGPRLTAFLRGLFVPTP